MRIRNYAGKLKNWLNDTPANCKPDNCFVRPTRTAQPAKMKFIKNGEVVGSVNLQKL